MIKLICVTPDNNNKFYYMENLNNGKFKVEYGRVGASSTTVFYDISKWDKKYNEKIKKGYIDVTEKISTKAKTSEINIDDADVKDLISFLMKESKQSILRDYSVSSGNVTKEQLDLVQDKLDKISSFSDYKEINEKLKEIYTIIPRKMYDTRDYFLKSFDYNFLTDLLQKEQKRLDTLRTQVSIDNNSESITLDSLGFSCELASEKDRKFIANNTDFRVKDQRIFKISNKETEKVFNPNKLKTKLLYHGSRNENFLSILQNGLKIRPTGVATTGSMFGNGIYAANKARKSIGYTSLRGSYWASGSSNRAYLAIFEFATGNEYPILKNQSYQYWMGKLTKSEVNRKGYDSVFAEGGADLRNDEYIVYDSNQCTIRYLIELTE